jgi:hypothetical protein
MATRDNLDEFTTAYIECALWSETDNTDDSGGEPLDKNYSIDDVADEAIEKMAADCAKFQTDNAELLIKAYAAARCTCGFSTKPTYSAHYHAASCDASRPHMYDAEKAGHDFWLTRNGHGAGFWDRNLGGIGDKLTKACEYDECNLYVGDDGKIHVS